MAFVAFIKIFHRLSCALLVFNANFPFLQIHEVYVRKLTFFEILLKVWTNIILATKVCNFAWGERFSKVVKAGFQVGLRKNWFFGRRELFLHQ